MSKIRNPFVKREGYNCFGCSPDNKQGLRLNFEVDGDFVVARWQPEPQFQGWNNTLHGGIQATLLDELASWLVFVKLNTSGVTSKMEVKLRKPVTTNQGDLFLKGKLREMKRNIAVIDTWLYNSEMVMCTEAVMYYFTFPQDIAKEKFWYPGSDAFLDAQD